MEKGKLEYLQMIQGTIDRMSTSSAIFKGFTATIVAGISAFSFGDINKYILFLPFIPIFCFLILDIYYLQLERRYRFLFESVRTDRKTIDFYMHPPKAKEIIKVDRNAHVGIIYCIASPSILWFYVPMIVTSILVLVLAYRGCLK